MKMMTIAVVALAGAIGCSGRSDPVYTFADLVFPGAASTMAAGLNDEGHVVGWYTMDGRTRGYIYRDGTYTSFEYPGAVLTHLNAITTDGDIVGSYRPAGAPQIGYHGFLRTASGDLLDIVHPIYKYSMARGLLADGSVVGCLHDDDVEKTMRGVRIRRDAIGRNPAPADAFDVLDRPSSMHNGGTPDGSRIVGVVTNTGEAYTLERNGATMFTAPGASQTEAWGINASGTIAGVFVDAASVTHGLILENNRFATIDVPGATTTVILGINGRGDIVGGYETADGQRRGFIGRRQ